MDQVDVCVIGAGVVGLAIGRALAAKGREVVVVDREVHFGQGVSSRNSEVIHAGIYYPQGSLKALLCVVGKKMLYDYCESRGIAHSRCGKLIVATAVEEEEELLKIREKALANGVDDLEDWPSDKVGQAEPRVRATAALFSPSTGIVSSHELMQALLADIEHGGGGFVGQTDVRAIHKDERGFVIESVASGERYDFVATCVVNAAGLGAQQVAQAADFIDRDSIPPLYYCKGNYFTLVGKSPFKHLIYPVPEKSGAGLGVHATIDLGGQARFGPDVEYIDHEDYTVSESRVDQYYAAVRRYYPGLEDGALAPAYVGIRPKLQGPHDPPRDFVVEGEQTHGIAGYVQLFGIESPGLTSSLAIADHCCDLLD